MSDQPKSFALMQMWVSMNSTSYARRGEDYHYAPVDEDGYIYFQGKPFVKSYDINPATITQWPKTYHEAKLHAPAGVRWVSDYDKEPK